MTVHAPRQTPESVRAARWALFVLTLINLLNYLDRYLPAALVEPLRRSELHVSDTRSGLLMTSFMVVYIVTSPVFGALGDRGRRPRIIAAGIALWSVATALGGLARSFASLLFARSLVGVGEAAYITISPAMLADSFPRNERGRVFAIFNAAIPIGAAAAYIVGGLVASHFGWRAAFFVAGVPGLLLAVMMWRMPDPPRGAADETAERAETVPAAAAEAPAADEAPAAEEKTAPTTRVDATPARSKATLAEVYADLARNRPFVLIVLGYSAYTFALGALAFWTPAFLERVRGVPHSQATVQFGIIVVATGFAGTFAGGWLGDMLLRRWSEAYLWVSGIATLAAAPVALLAFEAASRPVYMSAIVGAEVLLFLSTGPINSALVNVVSPAHRATAMALNTLVIHLLGDVPSPPLVGRLSDATSLGAAFRVLPAMMVVAGLIWLYAAWRGQRGQRGQRDQRGQRGQSGQHGQSGQRAVPSPVE
jgi:MFS family permease